MTLFMISDRKQRPLFSFVIRQKSKHAFFYAHSMFRQHFLSWKKELNNSDCDNLKDGLLMNPPQPGIIFSFVQPGSTIQKRLDISYNPDNKMKILNVQISDFRAH
jgi:hypothetical protein